MTPPAEAHQNSHLARQTWSGGHTGHWPMLRQWHLQKIISRGGGQAWTFTTVVPHSSDVRPLMEYIDFHHATEARFEIDGLPYEVYAHDRRRLAGRRLA